MAFDPAPSSWIYDWSEDGTDVTFPIASVSGLDSSVSDGITGDWRTCLLCLIQHSYVYYSGLGSDKPTKLEITRSMFFDQEGAAKVSYTIIGDIVPTLLGVTMELESE